MHNFYLHAGNVLYLLAYLIRDILWLRVVTIIALVALVLYYLTCPEGPLLMPLRWNALFILINLVQVVILVFERVPVFLGEEELRVYRAVFRSLTPREYVKLMRLATSGRAQPGEKLLQEGADVEKLTLITAGRASVLVKERPVARLTPLQFLGEMAFLTGEPASASVTADERVDYIQWQASDLRNLAISSPQLDAKLQRVLGADLVLKLRNRILGSEHPSLRG
ncbi:MAG: cyclic nucleotide-binding domain-containing protein [Planctomycetales bacterium]|nr:cyclic nucleotide-binding domain-containing protein [Planctomycetales bacterium]